MTTLYASICEESTFPVKRICSVTTNNESQDKDENAKIVECNKRSGEVIIEKVRKISS